MTRVRVTSEAIASIGYNPRDQRLEIEFHDGDVYQYFKVPADRHAALMTTSSPGHYFQEFIRDHYPYRRLNERGAAASAEGGSDDDRSE